MMDSRDALAELSARLWVRMCAYLCSKEQTQDFPFMRDADGKPQFNPALVTAMRYAYGFKREELNGIDIEIDGLLASHSPGDPLEMKVVAMQQAARKISHHLWGMHELAVPQYVVYGILREEIDAMRHARGTTSERTP